jgi:hypothetical protein
MRKSTIPEWAIARGRLEEDGSGDELVHEVQFVSNLVVSGSSLEYRDLTPSERTTADKLLRMGVLIETPVGSKKVELAEAWRRAIAKRRNRKLRS